MGVVGLSAEQRVDAPPAAVFALFGSGAGAGWLFDAVCDRPAVGAAVTLHAPLGGPGGDPVAVIGRITGVRAGSRIEIRHDQPWRGRLRILFDPDGPGTRVRLIADLDAAGLEWLMRRRGHRLGGAPQPDVHAIGLLVSKSGPANVSAAASEHMAEMAVAEVNADGGLGGHPVQLVVGDDATDAAVGAGEARRLVGAGCRVVIAVTTSATVARAAAELRGAGVLLVHTLAPDAGGGLRLGLGARPRDQLAAAARPLMRAAGGRHWFLAGSDYVWPRGAHRAAREVLGREDATVVGEGFAPLGTADFAPLVDRILRSGADLVLSSFIGADLVAFERQCHAMGVRDRALSLGLTFDEPSRERVGDAAATGVWSVSTYFEQAPGLRDRDVVRRYREAHGRFAPPLSAVSESAYTAVHRYAAAVRRAGSEDPRELARAMRPDRPQGLYLAEARPGGFTVQAAERGSTP